MRLGLLILTSLFFWLLMTPALCVADGDLSAPEQGAAYAGQSQWRAGAPLPLPVLFCGASAVEDKAVLTGGLVLGASTNTVYVYDVDHDRWAEPCRLLAPRDSHAQVTLPDGRVLVLGGQRRVVGGRPQSPIECEIVDIEAGMSAEAAPLPGPMPRPRALLLPNGRVAAVGGKYALTFDPQTLRWSDPIKLHYSRENHAAVALGPDRVLAIAGSGRRSVELIDFEARTSRVLDIRLPAPTDDLQALLLQDGRVWILGGQHGITAETLDATWLLAIGEDGESSLADGPGLGHAPGIADAELVQAGNRWLMIGGESETGRRDTELNITRILDPVMLTVKPGPTMQSPHDDTRALSIGGWAVVFGGYLPDAMTLGPVTLPGGIRRVERLALPLDEAGN